MKHKDLSAFWQTGIIRVLDIGDVLDYVNKSFEDNSVLNGIFIGYVAL